MHTYVHVYELVLSSSQYAGFKFQKYSRHSRPIITPTVEAESASKLAVQKGFNYQSQCKIELLLQLQQLQSAGQSLPLIVV